MINFKYSLTLITATAIGLSLGVVETAQASLLVNVTGTAGSGQTIWVFSGSSTASSNGVFGLTPGDSPEEWRNVGDYVADTLLNAISISPSSGSASITNSQETRSISLIGIDYDGNSSSSNNDDFGIGVANQPLNIITGDLVSWTGTLLLPLDITQFKLGTYGPAQGGAIGGLTDIQLTFKSVPESTGIIGLLVAGTFGLALCRRKV
ncbi:MAG: PEP-CTERM sorting domain-containing protein [Microcystis wesenbergii TW10]|jgi:hypothetical protein|uniref:PEP-CTERM protein-sorting domain-containing protein n=3 Tax=Microcystis TaxID=1125 RepID=A0A0A1VWF7_MICAE|nr:MULTISPECIES: PEP-CTERM sorting domain-containing protein [Microcystis]MBD2116730.1 PEP-CTERM sorting domain-containing protein [Microcystis wesenbergii FACHB-1339]MDT3673221.1 PEP-CTERM sorting domain-containing protein [Microcystis wesenbergii NRERC-220]REJ51240.1 MAG: PEP-CTERM sorting domain-containing protein [Microcystis wesenbergii TW10]GAL94167.1 hypothetical protein N44_02747 [Microcystis aeruginosa NIES-44]